MFYTTSYFIFQRNGYPYIAWVTNMCIMHCLGENIYLINFNGFFSDLQMFLWFEQNSKKTTNKPILRIRVNAIKV